MASVFHWYSCVQFGYKSAQRTEHRYAISDLAAHCFGSLSTRQVPRIQDLEARLTMTNELTAYIKHNGQRTYQAGLDAAFGAASQAQQVTNITSAALTAVVRICESLLIPKLDR